MLATVIINFCLVLHGYTASTRVDVTYIGFVVISDDHMSLVLRKPVFGFSDRVLHKPDCAVTEDG